MSDQPTEFRFEVTNDDIVAAIDRGDYAWPALVQFLDQRHTDALVKGSTLPRSRRPAGTRRHRHRTRRSGEFRPRDG
jgi:hypothetical protein